MCSDRLSERRRLSFWKSNSWVQSLSAPGEKTSYAAGCIVEEFRKAHDYFCALPIIGRNLSS